MVWDTLAWDTPVWDIATLATDTAATHTPECTVTMDITALESARLRLNLRLIPRLIMLLTDMLLLMLMATTVWDTLVWGTDTLVWDMALVDTAVTLATTNLHDDHSETNQWYGYSRLGYGLGGYRSYFGYY